MTQSSPDIVDRVAEAMWRVNKETNGLRFTELLKEMARVAVETVERSQCSADSATVQRAADYLFEETTKLDAPISYTACLVLVRHILGTQPSEQSGWWRGISDREPDHGQYANGGPAEQATPNVAQGSLDGGMYGEYTPVTVRGSSAQAAQDWAAEALRRFGPIPVGAGENSRLIAAYHYAFVEGAKAALALPSTEAPAQPPTAPDLERAKNALFDAIKARGYLLNEDELEVAAQAVIDAAMTRPQREASR